MINKDNGFIIRKRSSIIDIRILKMIDNVSYIFRVLYSLLAKIFTTLTTTLNTDYDKNHSTMQIFRLNDISVFWFCPKTDTWIELLNALLILIVSNGEG